MSDNPTAGTPPAATPDAPPAAAAPPPASVVQPAPASPEAPAHVENAQASGEGKSDAPASGRAGTDDGGVPSVGEAPTAEPPAEAAPEPPPAEPEPTVPTYAEFKLPDGFKIAPEKLAEATAVLGKYGVPQEAAQELVNLHAAGLQAALENYGKSAADFWNNKAKEWTGEAKADPTFGGNRFETSLTAARGVWNEVLPNKADRDRLFGDFNDTKMGDHPVLFKAMAEVGRRMQQVLTATGTTTWTAAMKKIREPAPPPPGNPARAPGAAGRPADRRYQNTNRA